MPVTLDIIKKLPKDKPKSGLLPIGSQITFTWTSNATKLVINGTDYPASGSITVKVNGPEKFYDFIASDGAGSISKTVSIPGGYR
jgi:hypothetical protein